MSHFALTLQQFLQPAPVCELTVGLHTLQSLFESGQNEIIIALGERENPIGAIAFKALIPYLNCQVQPFYNPARARGTVDRSSIPIEQFDARTLIAPILSLPATTSVKDFLSYLQAGHLDAKEVQLCALVDEDGKFKGLLDSWRLFSSLLPVYSDLEMLPPTTSPARATLLQLLDRLPIPLMLQTPRDELRYPNRAWRDRLGESSESLRGSGVELSETSYPYSSWCNLTQDADSLNAPARAGASYSMETGLKSHLNLNTIATWQFIKVPLEVASQLNLDFISPPLETAFSSLQTPMWLILATDITEQRQLCKELAAKNADLIQLNRLKDDFLACISHELKTPLTAVLGLSTLLKDRKLGELTPRQERYASLIYQSGRQLMSVVNDLLDLTRIEAGQLKLNIEPVRIEEICNRAYEQARTHLARKAAEDEPEVRFTLAIEPGLTAIVADELRLRQMLVHLLDNALKFTPADGEIGLEVSRWEAWIEFTVWDTGIGIPEDSQHLIFQKFQQLESPLTRQFEGTGLGLVLTQRLARAHGGDISFISRAGEGSQFTLLLPPSPPDERAVRQTAAGEGISKTTVASSALLKPANPLILIVESALVAIEQLNDRLQKLGYRVAIARSGTEALEKARGLQPCAILLAPLLPLLSGWDVLTLLKADEKTRHIPVAITATRGEKELALQNGADGFLALPPEKAALQELLYRLDERDRRSATGSVRTGTRSVTILRLNHEGTHLDEERRKLTAEFDRALLTRSAKLNYRILATDDLEQAEVLARVWRPDVLLLEDLSLDDPGTYLRSLKNHERLAALPLVTLDAKITEAANQIEGLLVFPCLVPADPQGITALLQVIQIAMGLTQQPQISIVSNWQCDKGDQCGQWSSSLDELDDCALRQGRIPRFDLKRIRTHPSGSLRDLDKRFAAYERLCDAGEIEFLQAFMQYLEKAGLKCFQTCAWPEIYSQIQHQGIDLLLLYLGQQETSPSGVVPSTSKLFLKELRQLAHLPVKPPIFVLDRRTSEQIHTEVELNALLQEVATFIVEGHSYSCVDLLEQIHQLLPG
ncbi:response regulator [Oscillatoria sp. FACHB-1406]|nr:response regulator [Oscillatoria sp. FACHB-1406]